MRLNRPSLARLAFAVAAVVALTAVFFGPSRVSSTLFTSEFGGYRGWSKAALASNGAIAVWEDGRLGWPYVKGFGARINSAGTTVDPAGFAFSTLPGHVWDPAVSCIGNSCLIAWQQARDGVLIRTLDAATGTLGSITALKAAGTGSVTVAPDVANDGTRFLVAYCDDFNGVMGRFINTAGAPVGAAIQLAAVNGGVPTLAFGSGNYVVGVVDQWVNPARVLARTIDANGTQVAALSQLGLTNDSHWPVAVTYTTVGFLVSWSDNNLALTTRRLSTSGANVDATPQHPIVGAGNRTFVATSFDGSAVLFVWVNNDVELHAARISATLTVATPETTVLVRPDTTHLFQGTRLTETAGNRALLVWWLDDFRAPIIFQSRFINSSGAGVSLAAGGQITQTTADLHQSPEVAPWRNGFMVSYHSQFDGGGRGVGQLVNGVGNTVGAPLLLGSTPNQLFAPSVSSNGTTAWFAYTESGTVSVVPADTNGLLGAPSIVGSGFVWASTPSVASLGGSMVVVWAGDNGTTQNLYLRGLASNGVPQGATYTTLPLPSVNSFWQSRPRLKASNTQYGLVWVDGTQPFFSRLSAAGALLDGTGRSIDTNCVKVDLASDGTNFLVVWSPQSGGNVLARRMSGTTGLTLDTTPITISPYNAVAGSTQNPAEPSVVFDGTNYIVTWGETVDDAGLDIQRRTVSPSGALGAPELIAGGQGDQQRPAIALGAQGQIAHVWLEPDVGAGTLRVADLVSAVAAFDASVQLGDGGSADAGAPDAGPPDAGAPDAGPADAGAPDAGGNDGGDSDAGAPDGGAADGGSVDGGSPDAGSIDGGDTDGGSLDGGSPDGGSADGSVDGGSSDGGSSDAGADDGGMLDGGSIDGGPQGPLVLTVGCGCQGATDVSPLVWLAAGVWLLRRRRV